MLYSEKMCSPNFPWMEGTGCVDKSWGLASTLVFFHGNSQLMSVPKFPSSSMSRPTSLPVTPPSSPSAPAAKSSKTTIASSTSRCGRAGGSCGALSELFGTLQPSWFFGFQCWNSFLQDRKKMGHTDSLTFTIQMVCPKYTYIQWEFLFPAGKFSSQPDLRFLTTWLLVLFRSSTLTTLVFSTQESTNRTAFTEMLK